ncbi:MAG: alpha-L-fucosidase [Dysgonamonadaceae bacterium]|jgi:alpha-L-fucosidase|nr:alpha-L-fucosidase [Dysgonamonadaceae bacterium]
MRKIKILLLFCFLALNIAAQEAKKLSTDWFEAARFGMFVHFGPYSVLGNGEWNMNTYPITKKEYSVLQDIFNPQAFDAAAWVKTAKDGGMKYITVTARHHDGFSMWDTQQSDWNIMNTPYGKDILKQLAAECKKQNLKLCFYYSLLDWYRNDYQWTTGRTGHRAGRDSTLINWDSYIRFMKAQLTELLTNYGEIGVIWFDGHWDQTADDNRTTHDTKIDWHYAEIYSLIRKLQPNCLIANNHHLPPIEGEDYQIFERDVPGTNESGLSGQEISRLPLETCTTMNKSWGWYITDDDWKSPAEIIQLLVKTAGASANLLMNVGPMPNGVIPPECVDRLKTVGEWLKNYGQTIYETKQGPVTPQAWGVSTQMQNAKGKMQKDVVYLHILDKNTQELDLQISNIQSARFLNLPDKLVWKKDKKSGKVHFTLPEKLDEIDTIIEIAVFRF